MTSWPWGICLAATRIELLFTLARMLLASQLWLTRAMLGLTEVPIRSQSKLAVLDTVCTEWELKACTLMSWWMRRRMKVSAELRLRCPFRFAVDPEV